MSAAATRDAAAINSENGGKKSNSAAVAASDPAQDAAFVKGAIANALPQLLPGSRNADVTLRAEVPGVVERPEAVPGKPLAVAPASGGGSNENGAAPNNNGKPVAEKKDGIFFQDVTAPSTAPLVLANQEGDPNGPKPPPPKPASALIASENAVAETAKRTAGDASADIVRAKGAAALPVLTSEKEAKLEAAFDKFFDTLTSPQTEEMVQKASRGALNGALAAASSSSAAGGGNDNNQNALASVVERGGSLPAGNEPDATNPGGVGGNAGFLGIPLSDVKRVARSSDSRRSMLHLGGREPPPSSSSQASSPPPQQQPPPLPAPVISASSAPQPIGHNPPSYNNNDDGLGPDHRPPSLAALDSGGDSTAGTAAGVLAAEVAEVASVASPAPSPAMAQAKEKQFFVAPETAFEAAAAASSPAAAAISRPALEARSTSSSPIGHLPPHGNSALSRGGSAPMDHLPPIDHNPPLSGVEV